MTKQLVILVCALCALFAVGCVEEESSAPELLSYDQALSPNGQMCGGIAGFTCPEGQKCLITERDVADAAGVCVGASKVDECAYVRCASILCPEGFEPVPTGRDCCSQICRRAPKQDTQPEGACTTAADCEGLVHIMCVGSWSCEAGWCSYSCDGAVVEAL